MKKLALGANKKSLRAGTKRLFLKEERHYVCQKQETVVSSKVTGNKAIIDLLPTHISGIVRIKLSRINNKSMTNKVVCLVNIIGNQPRLDHTVITRYMDAYSPETTRYRLLPPSR